jgi:hypothetical protein
MNFEQRPNSNLKNDNFNILDTNNIRNDKQVIVDVNDPSNSSFAHNKKDLNKINGLFIQYGIIEGYDSKETVHMSYFDENPLEPRFYMFGRFNIFSQLL